MGLLVTCITVVLHLYALTSAVESAKILAYWPLAAHSHQILGVRLVTALANIGHEVTLVNVYEKKNQTTNYRSINMTGFNPFAAGEF